MSAARRVSPSTTMSSALQRGATSAVAIPASAGTRLGGGGRFRLQSSAPPCRTTYEQPGDEGGLAAPLHESAIPRDPHGHRITNGAGAVEKRTMVDGKEKEVSSAIFHKLRDSHREAHFTCVRTETVVYRELRDSH